MTFASVPVRANGDRVTEDWFNTLRTAGSALESMFGTGYISETQFTLANNQSETNLTGMTVNGSSSRSAIIEYQVYRKTSTDERVETGTILMNYKTIAATWGIDGGTSFGESGVTFTVATTGTTGQVKVASDNMSGSAYIGYIRFKAKTIAVEA